MAALRSDLLDPMMMYMHLADQREGVSCNISAACKRHEMHAKTMDHGSWMDPLASSKRHTPVNAAALTSLIAVDLAPPCMHAPLSYALCGWLALLRPARPRCTWRACWTSGTWSRPCCRPTPSATWPTRCVWWVGGQLACMRACLRYACACARDLHGMACGGAGLWRERVSGWGPCHAMSGHAMPCHARSCLPLQSSRCTSLAV